jgi:hypothetical protein
MGKIIRLTESQLKNVIKRIINENYDEYGDRIDYSKNYGKNNFKITHPQDDSGEYPDDYDPNYDDDNWQKQYDDDMSRESTLEKYRIFQEINYIFSEELNLKDYGLCDDNDDDDMCVSKLIIDEIDYGGPSWVSMMMILDYGVGLSREDIETILKNNLKPEDYEKLTIEYNVSKLGGNRKGKTSLGVISYYHR